MANKDNIIVLGAGAASWGAIDAGVKGVFGYPGTPSTEVFEEAEAIVRSLGDGRVARWAANEKAAYEMALGASYAGARSIVTMKHVGLNVAMDPFVNSALTGVNGGLVVICADDPGMHSSQNEQDSRVLAEFALIPTLEPATVQEVYDLTKSAFELSEQYHTPVLLRLVTRLAHARGFMARGEARGIALRPIVPIKDSEGWVLVPSRARDTYKRLRDKCDPIEKAVSEFNREEGSGSTALVLSGMGRAYALQQFGEHPELKQRFTIFHVVGYPLKEEMLSTLASRFKEIVVLEENYPHLEDKLRLVAAGTATKVHGRRDGRVALMGELTPHSVLAALGGTPPKGMAPSAMTPTPRLPRLCDGCGHRDAFKVMRSAAEAESLPALRFYGDIGCYTLGAYPPFDAIHTCVEMGASLGMAIGAALMGATPSVGIIGDSTFFHSGLPNLIALARSGANAKLVIMDNSTVAMTGQQQPVAEGIIPQLARAAGFAEDQIHQMIPLAKHHDENLKTFLQVLRHEGPDVVIFRRECIQAARTKR